MRRHALGILAFALAAAPAPAQTGQNRLDTAVEFEREGRFDEALKSYERLLQSDADPEVLLKAKLGAGRIYLEQKGDAAKAKPYFEEVAKQVRIPELAAVALVYNGKTMVLAAKSDTDIDGALSEFDTVIRAYPTSGAVVEALISAGPILEMRRKYERAVINYQTIVFQFPQSPLVPRAFIRLGRCLAKLGSTVEALEAYQNVQLRYPGTPAAAQARSEATLLYRLFLQKKLTASIFAQTIVAQKTKTFPIRNPHRIEVSRSGNLEIADEGRAMTVSPAGQLVPGAAPAIGDFTDVRGEVYRIAKNTVALPGGKPLLPVYKKELKNESYDEITALAVNQLGEMVISTKGPNGLFRVDRASGDTAAFHAAGGKARRILVDSENNYYVLDSETGSVSILDARGKSIASVAHQSFGMKGIKDIALDALDDLYLLDVQGQFVVLGGVGRADDLRLKPIHRQEVRDAQSKPLEDLAAFAVSPSGIVYAASREYLLAFQ